MTRAWTITAALALTAALGAASNAETIEKNGKTASGDTCSVKVEKHAERWRLLCVLRAVRNRRG